MDKHGKPYGILIRLSEPWYQAWFARTGEPPLPSLQPFQEAARSLRQKLFFGAIPEGACMDAVRALHQSARRSLDSVRLMYALADYFDEQPHEDEPSRGARWSQDLSRCLKAAAKMIRSLDGLGAEAFKGQIQSWAEDIGVRGAMFFPRMKTPRTWRTIARRLLRTDLTIEQVAILETAWMGPVNVAALAGDDDGPADRYPLRPDLSGQDPVGSVTAKLDEAQSRVRQPECKPARLQHDRLLIRIEDEGGVRFGAVNADAILPEYRHLHFEPLAPLPRV